jgi:hypothetical protein
MHDDGITLVFLTQGKVAIIDSADAERVLRYKWRFTPSGYAIRGGRKAEGLSKRDTVYMHRWLLNVPDGFETDHVNRDKLDNRRGNLRVCTHAENNRNGAVRACANSSGFKGVSWHKRSLRWRAYIRVDYRQIHLGHFVTAEEAACAYDRAAIEHFGEFAHLNFPP